MATIGRKLKIKKNDVTLVGALEKSFSINHEPVDVTNDDDDGWRRLLADSGVKSIEMSISGVSESETLRQIGLLEGVTSVLLTDLTMVWDDGDEVACDFFMSSYEETGSTADKVTFSATFQSSGEPTFTAGV